MTAAAVQGQHQLRPPPLAQRFVGHGCLERRHHHVVLPDGQRGLVPLVTGHLTEFDETGPLHLTDGRVHDLGEGVAPPERDRTSEQRFGFRRSVLTQQGSTVSEELLEPHGVHPITFHSQPVTIIGGRDQLVAPASGDRPESLAQPGDPHVDVLPPRRREVVAPHVGGEHPHGDGHTWAQRQRNEY